MRRSGPSFLAALGLTRLATIVVCAIVAGVIAGYALATLSNNDKSGASAAVQSVPADAAAGPDGALALKAVLMPATTDSGRRRRRARVEITVSLRNLSGKARPKTAAPALVIDGRRVHVDPAAEDVAGGLLRSVPALTSVTGILRFETAGDTTDRLTQKRRARLRIAGQTLPLKLAVTAAP